MQRTPASFVALSFPGAVQEPRKPPPAATRQSREATHFGVAHDEGTEKQARQQDSHGGEAGALASGPTREGRKKSGEEAEEQEGGPRGLLQFRAEARSRLSSLGAPGSRHSPDPHPPGDAWARGAATRRSAAAQPGQPG